MNYTVTIPAQEIDRKIQVIKAVRKLSGLGLKEAKDIVDKATGRMARNYDGYLVSATPGQASTFDVRPEFTPFDIGIEINGECEFLINDPADEFNYGLEIALNAVAAIGSRESARAVLQGLAYGLPEGDVRNALISAAGVA